MRKQITLAIDSVADRCHIAAISPAGLVRVPEVNTRCRRPTGIQPEVRPRRMPASARRLFCSSSRIAATGCAKLEIARCRSGGVSSSIHAR